MKNYLLILFVLLSMLSSAQTEQADNTTGNEMAKVYRSTDVNLKPQLKNGMYDLSAFISNNFKFPNITKKKIKIFASFIVEVDGTMTDIKTFHISIKDFPESDQVGIQTEEQKKIALEQSEAMKIETQRVLNSFTQRWIPAQKNGKSVRCLYNYPINFN